MMATTLSQQLKKKRKKAQEGENRRLVRGPGGQLSEMTDKSIQRRADALGAQVPMSPLAASTQGAGLDTAKMAGTKEQKGAALQLSTAGETELNRAQRKPMQAQAGAGESLAADFIAKAGDLEGAQGQAARLVSQELISRGAQADLGTIDVDAGLLEEEGFEAEAANQISNLLNTGTPENIAQAIEIAEQEGLPIPWDNIKELLPEEEAQIISDIFQGGKANTVAATDGFAAGLGIEGVSNLQQLGEFLNADLTNASLADVQAAFENRTQEVFEQKENAEAVLASPNASDAAKAEARETLRAMDETGFVDSAQEADALLNTLDEAGTITIGEDEYTFSELLGDGGFSTYVSAYIQTDPESEEYDQLVADLEEAFGPDDAKKILDQIEQNRGALAATVDEFTQEVGDVTESIDFNNKAKDLIGQEVLEAIIPEFNVYSGESYADDPFFNSPLYQELSKDGANPQLKSAIKEIGAADPQALKELAKLSPAELQELDKAGYESVVARAKVSGIMKTGQRPSNELIMRAIGLDKDMTFPEFENKLSNSVSYAMIVDPELYDRMSAQGLEKAVNTKAVANVMLRNLSKFNARNPINLDRILIEASEMPDIVDAFPRNMLSDGKLTADEINRIGYNKDTGMTLLDDISPDSPVLTEEAKVVLDKMLKEALPLQDVLKKGTRRYQEAERGRTLSRFPVKKTISAIKDGNRTLLYNLPEERTEEGQVILSDVLQDAEMANIWAEKALGGLENRLFSVRKQYPPGEERDRREQELRTKYEKQLRKIPMIVREEIGVEERFNNVDPRSTYAAPPKKKSKGQRRRQTVSNLAVGAREGAKTITGVRAAKAGIKKLFG